MESGFGKSLFGYRKEDVERSISQLESESQKRIKSLEDELESVKNQLRAAESARAGLQQKLEDANKKESAIVDLLIGAREKALQIEEEARDRAEQKLKDIDHEFAQKQQEIDRMRQKYSSFQNDFRGLLGRYTGMLSHLPELVFVDEERALPPGQTGLGGVASQLPPAAGGEWLAPAAEPDSSPVEDRFPGADDWHMPAGGPELFKKAEPAGEMAAPEANAAAVAGSPAEAALLEGEGEASEFRKALSSLNKLTYKPTVEEPWALESQPPAVAVDAGATVIDKGATAPLEEERPLFVPGPQQPLIDPKYKPFTPFSRKAEPEKVAEDKPSLEKSLFTAPPPENVPEEFPVRPEKSLFGGVNNGNGLQGFNDSDSLGGRNGLNGSASVAGWDNLPGPGAIPGPEAPVPESIVRASQELSRLRDEAFTPEGEALRSKGEEPAAAGMAPAAEGGALPFKPWESAAGPADPAPAPGPKGADTGNLAEVQQPFAEGASLKELLERHRQEMQRRSQSEEESSNGTLKVEMSEEDKKFWS